MNILCIAPHADDAELGMGGYLSRMVRDVIAYPTVGILAGGDYVNRHRRKIVGSQRALETAEAMRRLGVQDYVTLAAVDDNQFDLAGRAVLVAAIDALVGRSAYDEVFVCLPSFNQDHQATYDAVITAFRPGRWPMVKRIWAYEYPGNCMGPDRPATGRCYVTLQAIDMAAKRKALAAHESQHDLLEGRGPITLDGADCLARQRGSEAGAEFAELFWLIREIY